MTVLETNTTRMLKKQQEQALKRILIVDDNENVRNVLKTLLEASGFEVAVADDGDVGIKTFLQFRPALIITDIYMPRVPGVHMINEIKQGFPDVKVIVLSGGARGKTAYHVDADMGVNKILMKPIGKDKLMAAISEVMK